jgi:hypothetical protein
VDVPNGQIVERARRGVQPCFGDVQVAGGRLQIAVAEQKLDATQIGACIKQMCGEGVTQHMRAERLEMPSCLRSFSQVTRTVLAFKG